MFSLANDLLPLFIPPTVHPIAMNLSPPNGSIAAQLAGAANAVTFQCDVFQMDASRGELVQVTTTWTLQKPDGSLMLVVQFAFVGVFMIGGTPQPSGSFLPTYRNRLTVVSFTEDLDGSMLMCGTESETAGYFRLRLYSRFYNHIILLAL